MNILTFFSKNKTLSVFITISLLIFVIGVIGNSLIKNTIEDWPETSDELVQNTETKIIDLINIKQEALIKLEKKLISELNSITTADFSNIHSKIQHLLESNIRLSIYQKDQLVYWNEKYLDQSSFTEILIYEFGEIFFIQSDINSYFAVRDTFSVNDENYILFIADIAEKQYQLNEDYFSEISLKDEISNLIETDFNLEYSQKANKSNDGRKYSFEIKNNKDNTIGIATFLKPAREKAVRELESKIYNLQGFLALFGYLILGFLIFSFEKLINNRFLNFIGIAIYLVVFRYLLILLKFPQTLFTSELLGDKYYFSNFGNGLAHSPVELLITLILVFIFIYFSFKYSIDYYKSQKNRIVVNNFFQILSIVGGIIIYILALRGIGASIRGFVFDTSLRYFQNTSLAFSFPQVLMHVNVLIIGLISIVGSASILILVLSKFQRYNNEWNYKKILILILILFSAELVYSFFQNNPQLTILLKFLQILIVFVIVYLILVFDLKRITKIVMFFLAASIFSIGSLLYYNTELEKSSLKITANIISRFDDGWYKNLITETLLSEFSRVEAENAFANQSTNFNSSAFKIWSKSQLQKEAINSSVNFISLSGNLLGGFGSIYPSYTLDKYFDTNSVLEEIQIFEEPIENDSKKIIRGVFPVKDEFAFIGYLDVSILADLNNFGFSSHPEFISTGKLNEKAILKLDKLIILDYRDDELKIVYGNLNPTIQMNEAILEAELTEAHDAWIETNINNSEYLIYIKKIVVNGINRIIAVALREKELSIGLFDFFKIFFTHALLLLIIVTGYFLINYKSKINYQFDLRSKLLLTFLVISLIPLVLTAFYFRNLTEEKNKDAIYYKLGKRAFSVENYINENYDEKLDVDIYRKASEDLNINYSIFRQNKLEYSSHDLLYDVGLFSKMISPFAYNELIQNESQEILLEESVDKYKFSAFYYRANLLDEDIIIEVADGFNNIRLPLSGSEVDVFLFGIYSLAVVLIIIFSAIFANQISLPIRRITSATKSVAAGDLSLDIKTNAKGELGELVSGFQYMIQELKKNQTMLAEIEREEAWKEMAKQVAHEIKNPLTPMKLSVQQLIAAYKDKSDKFDLFFEKVTSTILSQIETLKNIATEFSNFARMPKLKVETINFNEVISSSINLFTDEKVKISFVPFNDETEISGDSEQLKRTMINLIRNSIQANSTIIKIYTKDNNNSIELFVEDNGVGIAEENLNKIFIANFTTKSDGMGLGLSMAKRYMNSTNGNISILDSSEEGTIIKLTFPK